MKGISMERLSAAIELRNAALALLRKQGAELTDGAIWFQRHTPENPEPRLAICLNQGAAGAQLLSVWATLSTGHAKVFTANWLGETVEVLSFRRGDWERELLAMSGSADVSVH